MRQVIGLVLSVLLLCTAAMAASDGELARQYMEEHPLPVALPEPLPVPAPPPAAKMAVAASDVARVKTSAGTATIARENKIIPANRDEKIYQGDTISTGKGGSLGIMFRDNTILSLGPESAVVIREFLFSPSEGKLSIVTRLLKGTAAYISGVIAKLSPQSVRFETPVATVGFRGTQFLVRLEEEGAK